MEDELTVNLVDLNLESFEAWLSSFEPDQCVGQAQSEVTCPIALYATQTTQLAVQVQPDQIEFTNGFQPLPDWAQDFISAVDRNAYDGLPIRAEEARLALRGEFHRPEQLYDPDFEEDEDYYEEDFELGDCDCHYCMPD